MSNPSPPSPPTLYTHRITYTVTFTHQITVEAALPYPTREALEDAEGDAILAIIDDPSMTILSSEVLDTIGDRVTLEYAITPGGPAQ